MGAARAELADRAAPPLAVETAATPTASPPATEEPRCVRAAPRDAAARSLTTRAARLGRDTFGDSDTGRRLPFALMGLLTVLATAGIAMRLVGPRAGLISGLVVLSMPLLTLQSRMLTSEIGTACGATLLVYGLVALSRLGARLGPPLDARPDARPGIALAAVDAAISVAALVLGSWLGFYGGGALLGLVVPIGAYAAAGGFGVPAFRRAERAAMTEPPRGGFLAHVPAMLATVATIGLVALLAHQLYELEDPTPGMMPPARQVFGHAIVSDGCWSWALGGLWRPDDDLRDELRQHVRADRLRHVPVGRARADRDGGAARREARGDRAVGALALAWGAGAWIASEAFQRKVGFTLYAGFPALALAIGVWLDSTLSRRARGDREAMPAGMMLVGLFVLLAVVEPRQGHALVRRSDHVAAGRRRGAAVSRSSRRCWPSRPRPGSS